MWSKWLRSYPMKLWTLKRMLVKDHQSHELSPFFKKPDNLPQPPEPPHMDFNLDSFSNDNFFSYHQQNHPNEHVLSGSTL
jgi:hypothetical protein